MKTLQLLQKNLVWTIPLFMIGGIIYGSLFDTSVFKSAILPLTFLMVYPMMVNLNFEQLFKGKDYKLQIVTQMINFVIIPFIGFWIGQLFFADLPYVAMGIFLTSLLPTSGMTISWTGIAKGNMPAAVKMTVIGLLLGSILAPIYLQTFMGSSIEIPMKQVFIEIAIIILIPMLLGFITKHLLVRVYGDARYQKDLKVKFPPFSTLGVLGIVFVAMAVKAKVIVEDPVVLLKYILPLLLIYLLNFLISTLVGKYIFKRGDAIALVYGTVMRNLSIALAIAMTVFKENGAEIALVIALGYIIQVQAAAWYVKFTTPLFGAAPPDVAKDIMHKGVLSLSDNKTIAEAIHFFEKEHVHSIVLQQSEKLLGILTTHNLFTHLTEVNNDAQQPLSSVKLDPIVVIQENTPIIDVVSKMKENHSIKVIVVDNKGNMTGVITETMYLDRLLKK